MIEGFQNPGLAIGAALCVVPLVIHLLNRQRHKPQQWAAMRFVFAAYKRTRRRVQLENWLLLLARMLAVAALAFAIARPFASGDSPLAALREERRDLIVVIDGSASTGYREDVETVFERIIERTNTLMADLDGGRGDRVRLVFGGARARVFPWTSPEDATSIVETLTSPLDESIDLAAVVGELVTTITDDRESGMSSALDVRLLTDLQAASFSAVRRSTPSVADNLETLGYAEDAESAPALAEQLDRLEALDVTLIVEDLGARALRPANLSVASVTILGDPPSVGAPFEIAVAVENHGDQNVLAERVALTLAGDRLPSQRIDVPARGRAEVVFTAELDDAGHHAITASLEGDRLGADDSRSLVVYAPDPLEILVVDGAPAERLVEDEVGYLLAVLEPPDDALGGEGSSPFRVRTISPAEFDSSESPIEEADVIVLANVPMVPSGAVTRLEERVRAGAGLLITAGDRMGDLARWSENLVRDDGTGLLPAELRRRVAAARRTSYYRVADFDQDWDGLRYFTDERRRQLLTEVPFYEFIAAEPLPGAFVRASFDDAARSPLLVERSYGEGRVALWTTSIDPAWNRVPDSGKTFVPLVLELFTTLGSRESQDRNLDVGDPVTVITETFPRDAVLVVPEGGQREIEGDPVERTDRRWRLPVLDGAWMERSGVYEVRADGARPEPIAVQLDAGESDLARSTSTEVEAIHPALRVAEIDDSSSARSDVAQPRQGELWRWLAMAALAFLVFESLWGAYIGSRRKVQS